MLHRQKLLTTTRQGQTVHRGATKRQTDKETYKQAGTHTKHIHTDEETLICKDMTFKAETFNLKVVAKVLTNIFVL